MERLFNSSLVVIVSQKEPRVMHIYHFKSKNMICDYKYAKSVLNVKLNRDVSAWRLLGKWLLNNETEHSILESCRLRRGFDIHLHTERYEGEHDL